jgi:hypothetical protein
VEDKPTYEELVEAIRDISAHLIAATSAYETFAGNHKRPGVRDALFGTRLKDYKNACDRARKICQRV